MRDQLRARGVRAPIAVVPTGVDLARFRPGVSRRRAPRARAAGRRRPWCSTSAASTARRASTACCWPSIGSPARCGGAHLWLVGQGKETEPLRRLAAGLAAGDRIHFAGVRAHDSLAAWYQAADLFLFASETETQGLVLAEAAACGLPAVAVIAPGCDEVVRDGETGILTKGDPAALAEAAIGLLLDAERRAAMGARARQVAVDGFDVALQIARTLDVYAEAQAHAAQRRG